MCIDSHMIIYLKNIWHINVHWLIHNNLSKKIFGTFVCIDSHILIYFKKFKHFIMHVKSHVTWGAMWWVDFRKKFV
jgi:hypothetical protein